MSKIPENIILQILASENSPQRFEQYANRIVSEIEGVPVLSTSRSWDLGRDGVAIKTTSPMFTCCSLRRDVESKTLSDIKRLLDFVPQKNQAKIYFCSSQPLSEHGREEIKSTILAAYPKHNFTLEVFGAANLAQLDIQFNAERGKSLGIAELYASEFSDLMRILEDQRNAGSDERSLRLALLAMGPDDSVAIRAQAYRSLILHSLNQATNGLASEGLAQTIASRLRLGRPLTITALREYLDQLIGDGFIEQAGTRYKVTQSGAEQVEQERQQAASQLLSGRQAVRTHLETLLGQTLQPDDFNRLWNAVEERLGGLLYARGEAIIQSTAALLSQGAKDAPTLDDYGRLVDELSDAAADAWGVPGKKLEVARAIKDMLTEGSGPACEWLVRVCCSFVALCSIGLESSSAGAIRQVIRNTEAILDTDVVLSLVCPGEPLYDDVADAHRRWTSLGGKVMLAAPVAEEVAHHAWIADIDYREVQNWLPGTFEDGLRQIRNAFARGFAALIRQKKAAKREWSTYISQFRGEGDTDTEVARTFLAAQYGFGELPPQRIENEPAGLTLYTKIKAQIDSNLKSNKISEKDGDIQLDKAERDARLIASIAHRRRELARSNQGTCCLVSSSQRLRDLPKILQRHHAEVPWVISPATWHCLLALVPGVSIGLTAMHSFLFDDYLRYRPSSHEQVLLRAIKESGQHALPWAGRVTLFKNVQSSVFRMANSMGVSRAAVKKMIEHPADNDQNRQVAATVLAEALDDMASESRTEQELRARIQALEEENRRLRKKR